MRVVFFGSGEFGRPTLERLARDHEVVGVVTQPDRPAGRGGKQTPTPIGAWAADRLAGVPLFKPEDVNESGVVAALRGLGGGIAGGVVWVVIAFGQKLGRPLLEGASAFNLHASRLPRWRGAAPINWAVLAGDAQTGNSVITLADRMDAGLVMASSSRMIGPTQTAGELHDELSADGPELVAGVLAAVARGDARGEAQDERLATRAPKLSREMARVDFGTSAEDVRRRINGLSPWPGVTVMFRGEAVKLLRAGPAEGSSAGDAGGRIVDAKAGVIACGSGTLVRLLDVQPAGKRVMSWGEFANGQRVAVGEVLHGGGVC